MAYQNIYVDYGDYENKAIYVWDDKEGLVTFPINEFRYAYRRDPKGKFLTMNGQRVSKVTKYSYGDTSLFESDLPMETRVLTDLYLEEDTPSEGHVVMFFDIEVSMTIGLPDTNEANNEITSIAIYDTASLKYSVFVLDVEGLYQNEISDDREIFFAKSEIDLLHMFMNSYEEIKPTIITGWNSNGFDVPYLYNRMRKVCGMNVANRLSPIEKVRYSDRMGRYIIAGVSSLDYLDLYKKFTYVQRENYRLDTIGRLELDMGKVEYEGSLDLLFKEDLNKFVEYNLQDVRIIVELDKKFDLIELVRGICHVGHVPYEDYNMSSRFLEGTIVTYLHRKGIIAPNKPEGGRDKMEELKSGNKKGFAGAYVKVPDAGLYEWVYSLDLQSLYPSVIMSLNISPESKVGFVLNWDMDAHFRKEIIAYVIKEIGNETTMELDYDDFMELLETEKLNISSNGVLYRTDKMGILPEVIDSWFAQRKEFKDLMKKYTNEGDEKLAGYYDRRQHIQKIFLNSLYGVLGLPVFRFYDVDNALAVTATGQDVIKNSAKVVNLHYQKALNSNELKDYVVYIDTDSVYASALPLMSSDLSFDEAKEFTISLAREMEDKLNRFYTVFAKRAFNSESHRLHIKGETIASTAFWTGKKRYAMKKVYDLETNQSLDKLSVKGLDVVRSTFPEAFRTFMKAFILDILNKVPKEKIDKDILKLKSSLSARNYIDIARNTGVNNLEKYSDMGPKIALNEFLKSTPRHIKAAIVYNRLIDKYNLGNKYAKITEGEKVKYVYLKNNPLRVEAIAVRGYQDPPEILSMIEQYIDTDTLFTKELRNKLVSFYTGLGWGKLPTEINQNANEFFKF